MYFSSFCEMICPIHLITSKKLYHKNNINSICPHKVAGSNPEGRKKGAMVKGGCFLPLKTRKGLENSVCAKRNIIDAKHHIVCGLPQLHLREAQPRSFVPKEWEMMFSRCSKWCWPSVKWFCALRHKWKILVPKNEDFWLPLLSLNLTTKRSLHKFRELPDGASAIAHNPHKRGDGVLA